MEWYVYRHDFNKRTIEKWNIFKHGRFTEDVKKLLEDDITKEEFTEELKHKLRYYFWSKCEYETIITSWPCYIDQTELNRLNSDYEESAAKYGHYPYKISVAPDVGEKVDIYSQVMMNFDVFVDYVYGYKK
jgi:hypothetical protein